MFVLSLVTWFGFVSRCWKIKLRSSWSKSFTGDYRLYFRIGFGDSEDGSMGCYIYVFSVRV